MSLHIEIDGDRKQWYTNQDIIKGRGILDLKSAMEVTSVKIALFGVSRTALTRVDDVGQKFQDNVEDVTTFLHANLKLFPPNDELHGSKYTLQAGKHSWPFEFTFPAVNTTGVMQYSLPPSLSDLDQSTASIKYYLEISCERASVVLGGGVKKSRFYIDFLPSDDYWIDRVPTYGALSSHKARVISNVKSVSGLFSRLISTLAHDKAPNCVDTVEFSIRTELLLTPGLKFTWFLEANPYHHSKETINVIGVKVALHCHTYVRAKNVDKNIDHQILLLDKSNIDAKAPCDVTSMSNSSALLIPEHVPPTFKTANIQRDYKLVYKIKWSHVPGSALTHKTELSQRVYLRSGICCLPNYDTGEVYRPSRNFPQAKWYYR